MHVSHNSIIIPALCSLPSSTYIIYLFLSYPRRYELRTAIKGNNISLRPHIESSTSIGWRFVRLFIPHLNLFAKFKWGIYCLTKKCHPIDVKCTLTCLISEQKKPCLINKQGDIFVENNKRISGILPNKQTYWHNTSRIKTNIGDICQKSCWINEQIAIIGLTTA